jgi:glycosyltransferase involved in cell wall biosynthesis
MKVLLTIVSSSSGMSGVQRHAINVVRCLLQRSEVSAVHLVIAPWQQELLEGAGLQPDTRLTTHVAQVTPGTLSRNLWYYRQLPHLAASLQPDLIHLSYPVPVDTAALECPTVLTLHDLYPYEIPQNFRFPQVLFNRLVLRQCLGNVDAIACVSDTTLLRMKQYTSPVVWRKTIRIYNCVEPEPFCSDRSPFPAWHGEPFLLCVAQHRCNKNLSLLIRVFHRLLCREQIGAAMKLVIVGITGPETPRLQQLIVRCNLSHRVLFLEGLSEPELQWCYAHGEALVVPSKTEGFGLPVAEALLAGCPVVCSDISAFREVGGQDCRFVLLGKGEEERLAKAISDTLQTPRTPRLTLPHLSSEVLANEYVSLYRRLLSLETSQPNVECVTPVHGITPERQSL